MVYLLVDIPALENILPIIFPLRTTYQYVLDF
jgi:hypothetical protein